MNWSTKTLRGAGLLLLYFARFLTTTVPAQALLACTFLVKPALPGKVWAYVLLVACYWATVFNLNPSHVPLHNLLFYFSFAIPSIIFISSKPNNADRWIATPFIQAICGLTLLEAIILNSPFASSISYLLPPNWATSTEHALLFGSYQRPLGIAGNASMTSGVLIFSTVLADASRRVLPNAAASASQHDSEKLRADQTSFFSHRTVLLTITILALASGTGLGLLILYFMSQSLARFNWTVGKLARFITILAIPSVILYGVFTSFNNIEGFSKFSSSYALSILNLKAATVSGAIESHAGVSALLFGNQVDVRKLTPDTSGDFGYGVMYNAIGALGASCVLLAPFIFASSVRKFLAPTIVFYTTFIHYPGLLSPPGAVVFGLYLYLLFRYETLMRMRRIPHQIGSAPDRLRTSR
jgi:hypothetical protein